MQIDWSTPNYRGSAITAYIIKVRGSDEITYTEDTVNCDGSDPLIRDATSCQIPFTALRTTPFSLQWGSSIWAKITAVNIYGNSVVSDPGNDAIILRVPDIPLDFSNVPEVTSATQIGLSWVEGTQNGGTPVIDYTIQYD